MPQLQVTLPWFFTCTKHLGSPFSCLKAAILSPGILFHCLLNISVSLNYSPGIGYAICLSSWLFSLEYNSWVITSRPPCLWQLWLSVVLICWAQEPVSLGLISDVLHRYGHGRTHTDSLWSVQFFNLSNGDDIGAK